MTEGLRRAPARLMQPAHRPWSLSGRRRGSEVPARCQTSFLALGSSSTAASCGKLVEENRPASATRGRRCASTWQPWLSSRAAGASTDDHSWTATGAIRLGMGSVSNRKTSHGVAQAAGTRSHSHTRGRGYTTHDRARISLASHTSHRQGDTIKYFYKSVPPGKSPATVVATVVVW